MQQKLWTLEAWRPASNLTQSYLHNFSLKYKFHTHPLESMLKQVAINKY